MKPVEIYARVRHAVLIEGISARAAAERFGINARTVSKMLKFSVPPGYVRTRPPFRPKLDAFVGIIDAILAADKERPKKQRHTAKRIFERLRDEHGFAGKITIVKDHVAGWRQRSQEMFVPLVHPPGHAQADFGEALGVIVNGTLNLTRVCREWQLGTDPPAPCGIVPLAKGTMPLKLFLASRFLSCWRGLPLLPPSWAVAGPGYRRGVCL